VYLAHEDAEPGEVGGAAFVPFATRDDADAYAAAVRRWGGGPGVRVGVIAADDGAW
jgi:hypothetical protein